MVLTRRFRRAPDQSCSYFTVVNIHINNECTKRSSVCTALLLLIRDLCMKLGAVILTGDFNRAGERKTLPGDFGERWISPLEAAFSHAEIPRPTFCGVTPLSGSRRRTQRWKHGLLVVVFSSFQTRKIIGLFYALSINVVLAVNGLRATDAIWHSEHLLHLKFAWRKKRGRDMFHADSSRGRRSCCTPTNERPASYLSFCESCFWSLALASFNLCQPHRTVALTAVIGVFCFFFVIVG